MLDHILISPDNRFLSFSTHDLGLYGAQTTPGLQVAPAASTGFQSAPEPSRAIDAAEPSGPVGAVAPAGADDAQILPVMVPELAPAAALAPAAWQFEPPRVQDVVPSAQGAGSIQPQPFQPSTDLVQAQAPSGTATPVSDAPSVGVGAAPTGVAAAVEPIGTILAGATAPVTALVEGTAGAVGGLIAPAAPVVDAVVAPLASALDAIVDAAVTPLAPVTDTVASLVDAAVAPATPALDLAGITVAAVVAPLAPVTDLVGDVSAAVAEPIAPITEAAAPIVDAVAEPLDPVLDGVAPVVDAILPPLGLQAAEPSPDEADDGLAGILGADPPGGIATLVSLVSVEDVFDVADQGTVTAEPLPSLIDTLAGEVSNGSPLLGDVGDGDGGLLGDLSDNDPLGLI